MSLLSFFLYKRPILASVNLVSIGPKRSTSWRTFIIKAAMHGLIGSPHGCLFSFSFAWSRNFISCFQNSLGMPSGPGAFPLGAFLIVLFTSLKLMSLPLSSFSFIFRCLFRSVKMFSMASFRSSSISGSHCSSEWWSLAIFNISVGVSVSSSEPDLKRDLIPVLDCLGLKRPNHCFEDFLFVRNHLASFRCVLVFLVSSSYLLSVLFWLLSIFLWASSFSGIQSFSCFSACCMSFSALFRNFVSSLRRLFVALSLAISSPSLY